MTDPALLQQPMLGAVLLSALDLASVTAALELLNSNIEGPVSLKPRLGFRSVHVLLWVCFWGLRIPLLPETGQAIGLNYLPV